MISRFLSGGPLVVPNEGRREWRRYFPSGFDVVACVWGYRMYKARINQPFDLKADNRIHYASLRSH